MANCFNSWSRLCWWQGPRTVRYCTMLLNTEKRFEYATTFRESCQPVLPSAESPGSSSDCISYVLACRDMRQLTDWKFTSTSVTDHKMQRRRRFYKDGRPSILKTAPGVGSGVNWWINRINECLN